MAVEKIAEYPKWCHDIKDGKVVRSVLVKDKNEEDALSFTKKSFQSEDKKKDWAK